jgi:hypothetical protein
MTYSSLQRGRRDSKTVRRHYAPIIQAWLPCSGIVRAFPRALVFGPIEYKWSGIHNLYTSRGTAHIERVLQP